MIVLGVDVGFASMGLALVQLGPESETLLKTWVVRTEKSSRKLAVRSADDTARRSRELAQELERVLREAGPGAVAIEAPSWPRSAGVSAKLGCAFGVLFGWAERYHLPLVMASPQDLKRALCGVKTASKGDVALAIERRFPAVEWPRAKTLIEHAADAIGAVVACLDSDVIRMARRTAA